MRYGLVILIAISTMAVGQDARSRSYLRDLDAYAQKHASAPYQVATMFLEQRKSQQAQEWGDFLSWEPRTRVESQIASRLDALLVEHPEVWRSHFVGESSVAERDTKGVAALDAKNRDLFISDFDVERRLCFAYLYTKAGMEACRRTLFSVRYIVDGQDMRRKDLSERAWEFASRILLARDLWKDLLNLTKFGEWIDEGSLRLALILFSHLGDETEVQKVKAILQRRNLHAMDMYLPALEERQKKVKKAHPLLQCFHAQGSIDASLIRLSDCGTEEENAEIERILRSKSEPIEPLIILRVEGASRFGVELKGQLITLVSHPIIDQSEFRLLKTPEKISRSWFAPGSVMISPAQAPGWGVVIETDRNETFLLIPMKEFVAELIEVGVFDDWAQFFRPKKDGGMK